MSAVENDNRQSNTWDLFSEFDNVVTSLFRPMQHSASSSVKSPRVPSVDIEENATSYVLTADLPGVGKDNIDISIDDGVLRLKGDVSNNPNEERTDAGVRVIRQERRLGKFERTLRLGDDVDETAIQASYVDGVLTLRLPKAERARPRKIKVQAH